MTDWIAFLALIGIPMLWFYLGRGPRPTTGLESPEQHTAFFRVATAELETPNCATTPDEVQDAFENFLTTVPVDVPAPVRTRMSIAVAEIVANLVRHGNSEKIQMTMAVGHNSMQVDFIDNGAPADIDLHTVDMPTELSENGWGLALARAALNELSYRHDHRGNHWKLVSLPFAPAT